MNALQRLRAALVPGVVFRMVENTYRPIVDGSIRIVRESGTSRYRYDELDRIKESNWGKIPTRVSDVTWIEENTVRHALPTRVGYTITLEFLPAFYRTPERTQQTISRARDLTPDPTRFGITWYGNDHSIACTGFIFDSIDEARTVGRRPDLVDPALYSFFGFDEKPAEISDARFASIETPGEDLDHIPVDPPLVGDLVQC